MWGIFFCNIARQDYQIVKTTSKMKKFSFQTILIIILGFAAHQFFQWWSIIIVAGLVGLFFNYKNSLSSWMAGFVGVALLWGFYAAFLNYGNLGLLANSIGDLFGGISGNQLICLTGLIGGIAGGFGAMTGTLGRKLISAS